MLLNAGVSPLSGNLFALLTLIVAPAVLTNASSVLALNTANRFGRVVDRSRQLVDEMREGIHAELNTLRGSQVGRLRLRAGLLLRAQTCFYAALGLFVTAALVSVVGSALAVDHKIAYRAAAIAGFAVGSTAALSLLYGCTLLVRETRLALLSLSEETALLEARFPPGRTDGSG
jgi:hypothetical protein